MATQVDRIAALLVAQAGAALEAGHDQGLRAHTRAVLEATIEALGHRAGRRTLTLAGELLARADPPEPAGLMTTPDLPVASGTRTDPAEADQELLATLGQLLRGPLPAVLATRWGAARLGDHLRIDLLSLTLALRRAGRRPQPAASTDAVRVIAAVLAEIRPGHAIEVRVPPCAAVQVGGLSGAPTHTRGTPPNVVETDPETLLDLADQRLSFDQAEKEGRVLVSGVHAHEVAGLLPRLARLR